VPISRLAESIGDSQAEADADADAAGLPYFIVGQVGDGSFYVGYLIDPDSP